MPKPYRFRHVNEIAGAFVLGVVTLLILGVVGVGFSQRWFTRSKEVTLRLPGGGEGLRPGADVRMRGTVVGSVEVVEPDENEQSNDMIAVMSVRSDFYKWIRKDSAASRTS